jgi:acyl-CoA reductase-like NAD-dependent aldehyde dehydrogenase
MARLATRRSAEVGRRFLGCAAESNAKQVALECGGKSAQVVLGDVKELQAAATAVAWGIFCNAGQTCNAGSRLIADASIRDDLVAAVVDIAESVAVGDPLDEATQMGPLVDSGQLERVRGYLAWQGRKARASSPAVAISRRPCWTAWPPRAGSPARTFSARC